MGLEFDDRHGGVGGDTTADLLARLDEALQSADRPPDIVILGIGFNDLLGGRSISHAVANINVTIDRIQEANPNVTIFLEQISGAKPDSGAAAINEQIPIFADDVATTATEQSTATSQVIPVDMYTNIPDSHFADAFHFNEIGVKAIAERYFTVLNEHLNRKSHQRAGS
jgi:lysophospholipase L1-like esterase